VTQPYLSIVITGRNDDHGGNFVRRFIRALAFNAARLVERAIPTEFVFVEWAPPCGRPLLVDVARGMLPDNVRAIVVDARYHEALTLNPHLAYLEFIAKNVGIRRAQGEFTLVTNADVYLGRRVLDCFERRALQNRVVYRAPRIDLKFGLDQSRLDWAALEDDRNHDTRRKPLQPPLYAGGTGDFVLLDRNTFVELRGFNEIYRVATIGIDRNFLVQALHGGVAIVDIGGPVYHVNHTSSYRVSKAHYRDREATAPYGDGRWSPDSVVYTNSEQWGLGDAPATALGDRVVRLDFARHSVPPLLQLSSIGSAAGQAFRTRRPRGERVPSASVQPGRPAFAPETTGD
jgi:hypothetical protein